MIKKVKTFGLFIIFLYMAQSWAVVINMEELYNPKLQQTVILMGDWHADASEVDDEQFNALFKAAKEYKAHVIIEGDADNCWWDSFMVLFRFARACWIARIPVSNIEFRKHVENLMAFAKHANNCKNLEEVKTFFEKNDTTRIDVFDSFIRMDAENSRVRKELEDFTGSLKAIGTKNVFEQELLFFIEDVLKKYAQTEKELKSLFPYHVGYDSSRKNKIVDAMIDNFFYENEGHVYTRADGNYWKAFTLQSVYLDLVVIKQMYALRNERVLFIYTGQAHTRRISTILRAIGFDLKFQISNEIEAERLYGPLHRTKELENLYKSQAMKSCCVNIEQFFDFCSTLPKYPESYSSYMLKVLAGTGVVAVGAWAAYMLFLKNHALATTSSAFYMGSTYSQSIFGTAHPFVPHHSTPEQLQSSNNFSYEKALLAGGFLTMITALIYSKTAGRNA